MLCFHTTDQHLLIPLCVKSISFCSPVFPFTLLTRGVTSALLLYYNELLYCSEHWERFQRCLQSTAFSCVHKGTFVLNLCAFVAFRIRKEAKSFKNFSGRLGLWGIWSLYHLVCLFRAFGNYFMPSRRYSVSNPPSTRSILIHHSDFFLLFFLSLHLSSALSLSHLSPFVLSSRLVSVLLTSLLPFPSTVLSLFFPSSSARYICS